MSNDEPFKIPDRERIVSVVQAQSMKKSNPKTDKKYKDELLGGLFYFALLMTTDERKSKALKKLEAYRFEIQELLEIIVPEGEVID